MISVLFTNIYNLYWFYCCWEFVNGVTNLVLLRILKVSRYYTIVGNDTENDLLQCKFWGNPLLDYCFNLNVVYEVAYLSSTKILSFVHLSLRIHCRWDWQLCSCKKYVFCLFSTFIRAFEICSCVCVLIAQLQPVMALFINGCTLDHGNEISITVFSLVYVSVSVSSCLWVKSNSAGD